MLIAPSTPASVDLDRALEPCRLAPAEDVLSCPTYEPRLSGDDDDDWSDDDLGEDPSKPDPLGGDGDEFDEFDEDDFDDEFDDDFEEEFEDDYAEEDDGFGDEFSDTSSDDDSGFEEDGDEDAGFEG